tara:strand:- start:1366 stop:2493 length:1128 start_codon:yes stop_codon:yes gene_type:complete
VPSSISSSSHRAPRLNYFREFLAALLVLVIFALPLIASNAYMDPFRVSSYGPKAELNRIKLFRSQNTALWRVAANDSLLRHLPESHNAELLILGDSRARLLTGKWTNDSSSFVIDDKGRQIFNLAYGGANLAESIRMFELYEDDFPKAETLVFVVNYDELEPAEVRDQLSEAGEIKKFPLAYYLSFRTFSFYHQMLLDKKEFPPRSTTQSHSLSPARLAPPKEIRNVKRGIGKRSVRKLFPKRQSARGAKNMRNKISAIQPQVTQAAIDDILKPFVERHPNKKFIFIITPLHPYLETVIAGPKRSAFDEMLGQLKALGPVYDASMYDGAQTVFTFSDALHMKNTGPDVLQDALDCLTGVKPYQSKIAHDGLSPCD